MCNASDRSVVSVHSCFLAGLLQPLSIGIVVASLSSMAVYAQDPDDEGGVARSVKLQRSTAASMVFRWVFGADLSGVAEADKYLETILSQRIDVIDCVCELTGAQKEKLQLAGRGDIKRFIGHVEKLASEIQRGGKPDALRVEAELLRSKLLVWLSDDDSLFLKTLQRISNAEQFARYAPLQAVYREGGLVWTRRVESNDVLEIHLTGTSAGDAGLAPLLKLPRVEILHLANMELTNSGLRQLKSVAGLRNLSLDRVDVTDEEITQLQSAVPGLEVVAGVTVLSKRGAGQDAGKALRIMIESTTDGQVDSVTIGLAKLFVGPLDPNRLRIFERRLKDAFENDGAIDRVLLQVGKDVTFSELIKLLTACTGPKIPGGRSVKTINLGGILDRQVAGMSRKLVRIEPPPPTNTDAEGLLLLNIDTHGELYVGGTKVTESFLQQEGARLNGKLKDEGRACATAVIRADPKTRFAVINRVMTECAKNGFLKVAFSDGKETQ